MTSSCCFFFVVCLFVLLEIVTEKRGRQEEDAWSVKYESIELCCSHDKERRIIINSNASK